MSPAGVLDELEEEDKRQYFECEFQCYQWSLSTVKKDNLKTFFCYQKIPPSYTHAHQNQLLFANRQREITLTACEVRGSFLLHVRCANLVDLRCFSKGGINLIVTL